MRTHIRFPVSHSDCVIYTENSVIDIWVEIRSHNFQLDHEVNQFDLFNQNSFPFISRSCTTNPVHIAHNVVDECVQKFDLYV